MHFCIRENQSSKQFWKPSVVKHPTAWSNASNISSLLLNWIPRSGFFIFWNRKKSQGLKFGKYGIFWYDSILFSGKFSIVIQVRWGRALSLCKNSSRNPVFSRLCTTASKIFDRQFVKYNRAPIEVPDPHPIDSIKANFMKKICHHSFLRIFVSSNFCWTRIIFWHACFSLLFAFRIIMRKPWFVTSNDVKNTLRSSLFESFQWLAKELNSKSFLIIGKWRMCYSPCAKPSVTLNDHVGFHKLLANLFPRKTRSVNLSHVDHRQSLIEHHRSFHRLVQSEFVQNEMNQTRPVFHVRIHETS